MFSLTVRSESLKSLLKLAGPFMYPPNMATKWRIFTSFIVMELIGTIKTIKTIKEGIIDIIPHRKT